MARGRERERKSESFKGRVKGRECRGGKRNLEGLGLGFLGRERKGK